MYRYALEKGSKKFTCPQCGAAKRFTRVIDTETGQYLPDHVGICDRSNSCGYQFTAKSHFEENRTLKNKTRFRPAKISTNVAFPKPDAVDYHGTQDLIDRLDNYDQNGLVRFLCDLFPYDADDVEAVIAEYWIGTHTDQYGAFTLLPYLDEQRRFCWGKLMRFNPATGRRLHGDYDTSTLATKLKISGFRYKQIFFGEHLLTKYPGRSLAIVESEKSAVLGSLCKGSFPEMIWLASGSKQTLQVEKLVRVSRGRTVLLFPDGDGYKAWQHVATEASKRGVTINLSDIIETLATPDEKTAGIDIADFLIREQQTINAHNREIDLFFESEMAEERGAIEAEEGCDP